MKHFYAHIIDLDDLHREFQILDLTDDEKNHLIVVIESSLHHVVIDVLLTELPEEHKENFLHHLAKNDHDSIWKVLKEAIQEPEERIRYALDKLKKELIKDIRDVHDSHNEKVEE